MRDQGRVVDGASRRLASWFAWVVCALSLALTALSYILIDLILSLDAPIFFYWLEPTVVAVGYSVIGAIIASRLPNHPIGWICCAIGFIAAVEHFSGEYAVYALVAHPDSLAGGNVTLWMSNWVWIFMFGLIVFLLLLFPNGRLPSNRWRPFAWFSAAVSVVGAILAAIAPDSTPGPNSEANALRSLPNPFGIEDLPNLQQPVQVFVLSVGLVAAASLVLVRLRNARGIERQQIKWLIYSSAMLIGAVILKDTVFSPLGQTPWGLWGGYLLVAIGGLGGPISIGIAILRYRLYEIDTLINRTLVYGSLTATLVGLYLVGIVALQRVFVLLTGQQSTLAVVASTLLIAALFTPLRRRIQSFIDRSFYRRKYDAAKTLKGFSMKLRNETDLAALSDDLVGVVKETMQPAHVSLWLRPETTQKGAQAE
jgi:MFS family permease